MDFQRDRLILSGEWECLPGHADAEIWRSGCGPAEVEWRPVEVPGPLFRRGRERAQNEKVECVWVRRRFDLSGDRAAGSAALKWGGIRFGATAYVNGRRVGSHAPIGPHTIHLPAGLLRKGANELLLKVNGWASLHKSKNGVPVIPVGADLFWGGRMPALWDDIWLEFYQRVCADRILAVPDLPGRKVVFRINLGPEADGLDAADVHAEVRIAATGEVVGTAQVQAPVGEFFLLEVPLSEVREWTPTRPELHRAELRVEAAGELCDRVGFRFGMREISVEDGHYRLNDRPLWFRGSNLVHEWTWGDTFNREIKRYVVDEARNMNLNCFRTHTLPPVTSWLDVCDEHGTMILAEFSTTFNYRDFGFTEEEWARWHANVLADAEAYIAKLGNHPAIVMWVLTNEPTEDHEWEAGPYLQRVLALDPTRPCLRTGETDFGTDSAVDLHLCDNYSYGPNSRLMVESGRAAAQKDPDRTLCCSEYMNLFGTREEITRRRLGRPDHPLRDRDRAACAAEDTERMRRLRLDMILPYMYARWARFRGNDWRPEYATPVAAALHGAMAPVLASPDLYDRHYAAGTEVWTPLHLINELHEKVELHLDAYLTPDDPLFVPDTTALEKALWHEERDVVLDADSVRVDELAWDVPDVQGTYYLALVCRRPGDRPVVSQREVHAVAAPGDVTPCSVAIAGRDDRLRKWLEAHDLECVDLRDAPKQADAALVVTGDRADLDAVIERGGRAVVVATEGLEGTCLPEFGVEETTPSSRVFAYEEGAEPLLRGMPEQFMMCWNGSDGDSLPGVIADRFLTGPAVTAGQKLLWVDDPEKPVAVSVGAGKGRVIILTLKLLDRLDPGGEAYDPVADRLLLNALR